MAICHGLADDDDYLEGRASPITFQELAKADCDYIDLGHVHVFRDVTQGPTPHLLLRLPLGVHRTLRRPRNP